MADQETQNAKDIALIKQEIGYLRDDVKDIKASLRVLVENYITRQDVDSKFERLQQEIDKRFDGANTRIDTKTSSEDFKELKEKIEEHLGNNAVNWNGIFQNVLTTIITAIILGGIIFAVQSGILK